MTRKSLTLIFSVLLLFGCANKSHINLKKPPQNAPSDDASIKLAEAANSVSDSLIELARIEKESKPSKYKKNLINVTTFNLEARASVDWSGPVDELVNKLANASFYKAHIIGRKPPIPVLVGLNVKDETLANILRNVDFQIGKKADLKVYPRRKVIELRYANM